MDVYLSVLEQPLYDCSFDFFSPKLCHRLVQSLGCEKETADFYTQIAGSL